MTKRIHYCYLLTRALPEGGCRYYVGIRTAPRNKTPETDTSYMGSGNRIRRAVKAHRAEFTKTILDVFDTREAARAMERALVGLPTANSPWSYNLRQGGEDHGLHSEESKAKLREVAVARHAHLTDDERRERLQAAHEASKTPEVRAKISATQRLRCAAMTDEERRQMIAKATEASRTLTHSPEVYAKISATLRLRCADMAGGERRAMTAKANEATRSYWARFSTKEARSAEMKRRAAVARENKRRKREVQMILAALIVNKYGGAEAA